MLLLSLKLIFVHFLADYPLQGDFLAAAKNHKNPIPGVPFYQALFAHAFIQAGGVWLVTGSLWLAFIELWAHAVIDYVKCGGHINYNEDQALHLICKALYVGALWV